MVPHTYGTDWWSKHLPETYRKGPCWPDLEGNGPLFRWFHHLLFYSGRTYPATKRSPWKVLLCELESKSGKIRLFPNSRPLSWPDHQQEWSRGGPRQNYLPCRLARYSGTKRELLAVLKFTRHFKHYLLVQKFTIITDHRALQCLLGFKDPDALTARWLEKLAAFNYEVVHANGLSRSPLRAFDTFVTEDPAADAPEEDQEWPNRTNENPPDPKHFQ